MTDRITEIDREIARLTEKVETRRARNREAAVTIQRLKDEKRVLETPVEPPRGAVIRFVKKFAGNPVTYTYTATRDERYGCWFATGITGPNNVSWSELIRFIRRDNTAPFGFELVTAQPTRLPTGTC